MSESPVQVRPWIGPLALLGVITCWSISPVILRNLTSVIDAWTANGIRYPLAALLYWPILLRAGLSRRLHRQLVIRCLLPAALALSAQVFWALAPYFLQASAIGFYSRLQLVWALLAAGLLFPDERRVLAHRRFLTGLVVCVAGFLLFTGSPLANGRSPSGTGVLIIVICSLFFGLYAVSVRHLMRGLDPLLGFGIVAQVVSVGTITGMLLLGEPARIPELPATAWLQLIGSSMVGIALGHFCMYTAVQRLGASIPSTVQSIMPFSIALLAWLCLGEQLATRQWIAGAAMVAGAAVLLTVRTEIETQTDTAGVAGRAPGKRAEGNTDAEPAVSV